MPIEYYICLVMYSLTVLFIGWYIGRKDSREEIKKYKTLWKDCYSLYNFYKSLYETQEKENIMIRNL